MPLTNYLAKHNWKHIYSTTQKFHKHVKYSQRKILLGCGIAAAGTLLCCRHFHHLVRGDVSLHREKRVFLPHVSAATPYDSDGKDNRGRFKHFNFIADVVEKASPTVVYIEILGR